MTTTVTRPTAAAPTNAAAAAASAPTAGTWLTTGDHKRLGLLFLYGGLASVAAGCLVAAIFQLPGVNDGPRIWTGAGSRLASANVALSLVIGVPALWLGLSTYLVPLQIGATRLALPRLHNLALWTYGAGGVLVAIGFLAGRAPISGLGSSAPAVARAGRSAQPVTEILIAGLLLVALATFLAAVSLLTTILNRRGAGVRLDYLPLFSWSALATSTVLVLATPVLMAGLVLLFYDQHYGGRLLASGAGGRRVWQHQLWLLGQPMALLFSAAALGAFGDMVATHARRPLLGFPVARIAAAAAPLLTLFLWTGNLSALRSPFGPVATLGGVVLGAPLVLCVLTWMRTLRAGQPRFHPGLVFVVAFLLVVGLAAALSVAAVFVGVTGGDAEAFRNGQITLLMLGAPLLGLMGAVVHWSPKLWGRPMPAGAALLQALLLLLGVTLTALPGYLIGFGAGEAVLPAGIAGSVLIAVGLLVVVVNIAGRTQAGEGDPYGGLTLEWATSSPPPVHNFDELPDVRSAHPLADVEAEG